MIDYSHFESGAFLNQRPTERIRRYHTADGRFEIQQAFQTNTGRLFWRAVELVDAYKVNEVKTPYGLTADPSDR